MQAHYADPVLEFIAERTPAIQGASADARRLNLAPGIEWREREQIRAIQGHLDHVIEQVVEMLGRREEGDNGDEDAAKLLSFLFDI